MEKVWRESKPKWMVEAAEAEIAGMKRRLALRWPDEARPAPVDFQWGGYDILRGNPREGTYFIIDYGRPKPLTIRETASWRKWEFQCGTDDKFSTNVVRGPLYETEKDAVLASLWEACDKAAADLEKVWDRLVKYRGFI